MTYCETPIRCPDCGGFASAYQGGDGLTHVWCRACDRRQRGVQDAARRHWQTVYPQWPPRLCGTLARAGITPAQLPQMSDAHLLAIRNFGQGYLATVRQACAAPPLPVVATCPQCGGTGIVSVAVEATQEVPA